MIGIARWYAAHERWIAREPSAPVYARCLCSVCGYTLRWRALERALEAAVWLKERA